MFANARDAFLRLFRRDMLDDLTAAIDARSPEPAIVTLVSIVFTTAPKTFTGSAVFVTGTVLPPIAATPTGRSSSSVPSSSSASSTSSPRPTTMVTSPSVNQLAVTSASATNTATAAPASSGGMSGGAKAGLAFGIILLLGLVGAFVLFMYKKRKEQNDEHQRLDDEKTFFAGGRNPDALPSHAAPAGGATFDSEMQSIPPREPAPQVSLRAVSQFEPGTSSQPAQASGLAPQAEAAAIAAATTAAVASATAAAASARTQQPASTAQTANNPENPFGNHAEQLGSSPPQEVPLPESPVDGAKAVEAADFPLPDTTPGTPKPKADASAAAAGAAAIAAATAAAASNKPQGSSTPTGSAGPENVHRVQLDFKPSMDDELEIKAGETVRVLHEYDDGWALCMKMDRSHQGVVPRTCLSKHPVKPRPSSPARGNPRGPQGMRGLPPSGPPPFAQPPRPLTPGSGRNSPGPSSYGGRASPGPGGRMSPSPYQPSSSAVPRPLTPTGGRNGPRNPAPYAQPGAGRSMSPGPYGGSRLRPQDGAAAAAGRNRSNSLGGIGASGSNGSATKLPGVSVSRKPVPSSSTVGSEILNA